MLRFARFLAIGVLALTCVGCSSGNVAPGLVAGRFAQESPYSGAVQSETTLNPQAAQAIQSFETGRDALPLSAVAASAHGLRRGLYALTSSDVFGFPANNRENASPFCSLGIAMTYPSGNISFDTKGRMIVPDYTAETVTVYDAPTKPQACGKMLGSFSTGGQPVDAASLDAASGRIVIAAEGPQVDICTLRHGCSMSFNAPNLAVIAGIALSTNGDCWAAGDQASGPGRLDYYKGCNSEGQTTTGYFGGYGDNYGGLDIDKHGNILSIFANFSNSPALYVYSGCNPACTMLSGPLPLHGNGTYGLLNKDSTEFAAGDSEYSSIDVYKYSPTSLTYEYSVDNGLKNVYGVAFNPRAAQ
jgi:hypothetical protein